MHDTVNNEYLKLIFFEPVTCLSFSTALFRITKLFYGNATVRAILLLVGSRMEIGIYHRVTCPENRFRLLMVGSLSQLFCRYGIEGPVSLSREGEWLVDEQQQKVRKSDNSIHHGVLQTVKIHMEVVEPQPNRPKLQLTLIEDTESREIVRRT